MRTVGLYRSWNVWFFFVLGWSSYFLIPLKTRSVMSELVILRFRVSSTSKFSTILLKCSLKISASYSLLLIVLLLLFKIMDSFWKAYSKKRVPIVFQNFLLFETMWSIFPEKRLLVLRSKLTHKFLWRLKRLLDSSFLVFKNLFLNFDLFITALLSSLVIKLQLFKRIYFIFSWSVLVNRRVTRNF